MNIFSIKKKMLLTGFMTSAFFWPGSSLAGADLNNIRPGAGQSEREIEQRRLEVPAVPEVGIQFPLEEPVAGASDSKPFVVLSFSISGNTIFPSERLLGLLKGFTGRELTMDGVHEAARRLTSYYRAHGYSLARAYVPPQTIRGGLVQLAVLEGHYGKVTIDNHAGLSRLAMAPLAGIRDGKLVRSADLERALAFMNERDGVAVRATLRPGGLSGDADLDLTVEPTRRLTGSLEYDNSGNYYNGEHRFSGRLALNNPLNLGDRLDGQLMGTNQEQIYYRFAWQTPLGSQGTSAGISYSFMQYELGEDFAALDAYGTARTAAAFITQPLYISQNLRLNANARYENRHLKDVIGLYSTTAQKRSNVGELALDGFVRDKTLAGAVSSFNISWRTGAIDLKDAATLADDALTAKRQGRFNVINPSFVRLQQLTDRFSVLGIVRGQWANKNLDASEKLGLGGAYGVRAYPQGEAQGDAGWLAVAELRYRVVHNLQAVGFFDHGWVKLNHTPWDKSKNTRSLSGAGIGANWTGHNLRLGVHAAWEVGSEKALSATNPRSPRVWLSAAWQF